MKRLVTLLVCMLLVVAHVSPAPTGALAASLQLALEAGEPTAPSMEIVNYSVRGVLDVSSVYELNLTLDWTVSEGDATNWRLTGLQAAATKDGFQQVRRNSSTSYSISPQPVDKYGGTSLPTTSKRISATFFFLKTGATDTLELELSATFDTGANTDSVSVTDTSSVLMVKTAPDPEPPVFEELDPEKYEPIVTVADDAPLPLLDQSTEVLTIPIRNTASYRASKIQIEMEPVNAASPLFVADRMVVNAEISTLGYNETKNAEFPVKLAPGALSGIHAVQLTFSYQNNHGASFTRTEMVYIRVQNQNAAPRLSAATSNLLQIGKSSIIRFSIRNSGTSDAHNIKLTLLGLSGNGVSTFNDVDVKYLDLIEGDSFETVEFSLFAAPSLTGSAAELQVRMEYTDVSGVAYSETNTVFLRLLGAEADEGSGVPRLIINKYSVTPSDIKAGDEFVLTLDLQNTSRSRAISNLKVTILQPEGVFLPRDASNTIFIEALPPQEVVTATLPLTTKADADNRPYSLQVTFDYEAGQGHSYQSQDIITIPVLQPPRLMVSEPVIWGEAYVYQMLPINVDFYNLGKTTLYNLMVTAEGPFRIEGSTYFAGNFSPGSQDAFSFAVTPTEPGPAAGSVIFRFEDSVGNVTEVVRSFSFEVMEMWIPEDPGGYQPEPQPEPTSPWLWIGIGGGALLIVVIGLLVLRRRRRIKIELQNSEDLTAAAQISVPEIEYVGFDEPETNEKKPEDSDQS